jgi:hypothetical protein
LFFPDGLQTWAAEQTVMQLTCVLLDDHPYDSIIAVQLSLRRDRQYVTKLPHLLKKKGITSESAFRLIEFKLVVWAVKGY